MIAVSIVLGILSGYGFYTGKIILAIISAVCFVALAVFLLFKSGNIDKAKIIFTFIFALVFIFGASSISFKLENYVNADLNNHYYVVDGRVCENTQTEYGGKCILDSVSVKGNVSGGLKYKVVVYYYGKKDIDVGSKINFYGLLKDKKLFYEQSFSATDVENGVKYIATINAEDIFVTGKSLTIFEQVHLFIRDTLKQGISGEEWKIGYGLLLGNTDQVDHAVIESYRSAGIAHVFAVSGLHVGVLAVALNFLLDRLRTKRWLKAVLITGVLFFYAGVCGFSASSVRATIMSAVLLFSAIKGRRYDPISSIGVACFLVLLISPVQLFCVGFQLSFAVVIGILLYSRKITSLFKFLPKKLSSILGVSLSAQLFGAPICLLAFNKFSVISILTNVLFVPVISVVFVYLLVAVLLGGAFGVPRITLFACDYLLKGINFLITSLDYKWFIIGGVSLGVLVIFYYLALFVPSGIIKLKRLTKSILAVSLALVFLVGTVVYNVRENSLSKVFVIGSQSVCCSVIKSGGQTTAVISDIDGVVSLNRLIRLKEKENITDIDNLIFAFDTNGKTQEYVTKIRTVFNLKRICYYGDKDQNTENIIKSSFGYDIVNYYDGEQIVKSQNICFALNGYAVTFVINGKKMAVTSKFGLTYAGYKGLNGDYFVIISSDYVSQINSFYSPDRIISYLDDVRFESADGNGTLVLRIE